jgi:hypothetical protein
VWRHARGDGAHRPSGQHGAKYRSLNHHVGFKSFSRISNFRGLGCSRKRAARDDPSPVTESRYFSFSPAAVSTGAPPPVSVPLFGVNSEPHTGARPSARLCVGLLSKVRKKGGITFRAKLFFKCREDQNRALLSPAFNNRAIERNILTNHFQIFRIEFSLFFPSTTLRHLCLAWRSVYFLRCLPW